MIIIKLGGSLFKQQKITTCLAHIEKIKIQQKMVLVIGGGMFVEQVRIAQKQWNFNDTIAHEMAILAMQQTALFCKSMQPDFEICHFVKTILTSTETKIIWSPKIEELNQFSIPATWEITSDSLSAWLAHVLDAEKLIVVKSAKIKPKIPISTLIETGILDKKFADFFDLDKTEVVNYSTFLNY